jgi:hypothetical protein
MTQTSLDSLDVLTRGDEQACEVMPSVVVAGSPQGGPEPSCGLSEWPSLKAHGGKLALVLGCQERSVKRATSLRLSSPVVLIQGQAEENS